MAMTYTNMRLPLNVMWMDSDEDVQELLRAFVGHECPLTQEPAIGCSSYGPWEEGDVWFEDNGGHYALHYDFMESAGRIFRYEIEKEG